MSERHAVALRFSPEQILNLLGLPEGTRVLGYRGDIDGSIVVGIEHESLPAIGEMSVIPECTLQVTLGEPLVFAEPMIAAWSFAPNKTWPTRLARRRSQ